MSDVAWEITHSVDSRASLPFAWAYMTDVANWDDPPAEFELEGPFLAGTRGITRMPGQEPYRWQIAEVHQFESYVLETALEGAVMSFAWRFDRHEHGTRLTQHIILKGEKAAAYVPGVAAAFASNLAAGMKKIVSAIERAEARGSAIASIPATDEG